MSATRDNIQTVQNGEEFYFVTDEHRQSGLGTGVRRSRSQRAVNELLLRDKFHVSSKITRDTSSQSNAQFPPTPVDPKVQQRLYWQPPRRDHYTDLIDSRAVLASQPRLHRYYPLACIDVDDRQAAAVEIVPLKPSSGNWWRRLQKHDKQHLRADQQSSSVSDPSKFAKGLRFDMYVGKNSNARTDYKRKEQGDRVDSTNTLLRQQDMWYGMPVDSKVSQNRLGHVRCAYLGAPRKAGTVNTGSKVTDGIHTRHASTTLNKTFKRAAPFSQSSSLSVEKTGIKKDVSDQLATLGAHAAFYTSQERQGANQFHPFLNILATMQKTKYTRRELQTLWYRFRVLCSLSGSTTAMNCSMLQHAVHRLGIEDQMLLARVCHIVDDDRSGTIEWSEFLQTVVSMERSEHGDMKMQCEFLVQCYDVDGDGLIGYDDLRTLFLHSSMLFIKEQKETQKLHKELLMLVSNGFFRSSDSARLEEYRKQVDAFVAKVSADLSDCENTTNKTAHDIINTFVDGVFKLLGKSGDGATISADDLVKYATEQGGNIDVWTIFGRTPLEGNK